MKTSTLAMVGGSFLFTFLLSGKALSREDTRFAMVRDLNTGRVTAILDRSVDPARALARDNPSLLKPTSAPITFAPADPRSPVAVANNFIEEHAKALDGTGPGLELVPYEIKTDKIGMRHVRYHQVYKGVRVYGSEVIVHLRADNAVRGLNGRVVNNIDVDTTPRLGKDRADAKAREFYAAQYGDEEATTLRAVLEVFNTEFFSRARPERFSLIWRVHLASAFSGISQVYFIDAQTGALLYQLEDTREAVGGNPNPVDRWVADCSRKMLGWSFVLVQREMECRPF